MNPNRELKTYLSDEQKAIIDKVWEETRLGAHALLLRAQEEGMIGYHTLIFISTSEKLTEQRLIHRLSAFKLCVYSYFTTQPTKLLVILSENSDTIDPIQAM